ncbi:expressed unknown protein [Ectocarpus siliculosus]|uniref:Uncharacterized protein n=1 Tax=Ectocarpus siliculosus TaxID=2880 RepID=D8LHD7_ECTSI|nr:expressed unknown protein [Ectocarpus siliculosus]|eukprot:CBN80254.1 expressed unknown protein [Ectocarpus siliculosus]
MTPRPHRRPGLRQRGNNAPMMGQQGALPRAKAPKIEQEELRNRLLNKVEEELARWQAKAAGAEAAATVATAAVAAVPAKESPLQAPEPVVSSTPLAPLQPYYYCDPLLDRTAHFAMDCGFYPGVAPVLLQHIVSTVYGAEFASSVATLSTADVDYMFHTFWTNVVSSYSRDEIFFRMTTHPGNGGITRDLGDFGWHIYGLTTGGADTPCVCVGYTECHGPNPDIGRYLFHGQWVSYPPAGNICAS